MSREKKHTITVRSWPSLRLGRPYRGQVREVRIDKKAMTLHVTIANLDRTMLERLHMVEISLPPRPGNRASRFLSACGHPGDEVGSETRVDELISATILMRFTPADDDYDIEFEKPKAPARKPPGEEEALEHDMAPLLSDTDWDR